MTSKKALALGCGAAALIALLVIIAAVLFLVHASKDVAGAAVWVGSPADVNIGETFPLEVTVTNERSDKALSLSDIDVAEEYLEGFSVSDIAPKPKSSMHVPIDNSRSFTFNEELPPRTAKTFVFTLRAEKPGTYRGDVDICEGVRFVTGLAQTTVKDKD